MFKTQLTSGVMGETPHCIPAAHREFALTLFEEALNLDDHARLFQAKGTWWVSFNASVPECHLAVQVARQRTNPRAKPSPFHS